MFNKLNLSDITVFCVDDIRPNEASDLLEQLSFKIDFFDVKLFSSQHTNAVKTNPISNISEYNNFLINELHSHINSEFAMCVQLDGYPLNFEAWDNDFLLYDYIGAPWTWVPRQLRKDSCPIGKAVGNGGFSIRSKKIMQEALKYNYCDEDPDEDIFLCRKISDELKGDGVNFAPVELAHYFSVENDIYKGQFGFHGKKTIEINQKQGIFK